MCFWNSTHLFDFILWSATSSCTVNRLGQRAILFHYRETCGKYQIAPKHLQGKSSWKIWSGRERWSRRPGTRKGRLTFYFSLYWYHFSWQKINILFSMWKVLRSFKSLTTIHFLKFHYKFSIGKGLIENFSRRLKYYPSDFIDGKSYFLLLSISGFLTHLTCFCSFKRIHWREDMA